MLQVTVSKNEPKPATVDCRSNRSKSRRDMTHGAGKHTQMIAMSSPGTTRLSVWPSWLGVILIESMNLSAISLNTSDRHKCEQGVIFRPNVRR